MSKNCRQLFGTKAKCTSGLTQSTDPDYWFVDPSYKDKSSIKKGRPGVDEEYLLGHFVAVELIRVKLGLTLMGACAYIACRSTQDRQSNGPKHHYYKIKARFEKEYGFVPISWTILELAKQETLPQVFDKSYYGKIFALYTEKAREIEITYSGLSHRKNHKSLANVTAFASYKIGTALDLREQLSNSGISITDYAPGQYRSTCPRCSHLRKGRNRRKKCLSVKIDNTGIAGVAYCHNDGCHWKKAFGFFKSRSHG